MYWTFISSSLGIGHTAFVALFARVQLLSLDTEPEELSSSQTRVIELSVDQLPSCQFAIEFRYQSLSKGSTAGFTTWEGNGCTFGSPTEDLLEERFALGGPSPQRQQSI